jgi:hypothetical protein
MSPILKGLFVIGIICLIFVMTFIGMYYKLVRLKNYFKNAYAQIDVELNRRYDLIPNLFGQIKDLGAIYRLPLIDFSLHV